MELKDFKRLHTTTQSLTLQKVTSKQWQILYKRYNPTTGEELEPGIETINLARINTAIEEAQSDIADVQERLDSLTYLKEQMLAIKGD